jgi:PAT family beta-lactamase induction signal transducer AmpG
MTIPWRTWPALLLLGFASGLPYPLVNDLLATWLTKSGYSTKDILLIGLVSWAYALKVLWAPVVDRLVPPLFGRRRGWLILLQAGLAVGIMAMAGCDPARQGPQTLVVIALAVAVLSATQDIVCDGYACEAVDQRRLGLAAGLKVWGYRLAMLIVGGWLLLLVAGDSLRLPGFVLDLPGIGWGGVLQICAGLMALGIIGSLLAPEPPRAAPATWRASLVEPMQALVADLGPGRLPLLLAFVIVYRLADGLAGLAIPIIMTKTFTLGDLGLWRAPAGLLGAGIGVAAAAWTVARFGVVPALWLFGIAQALSNLAYVGMAMGLVSGTNGLVATVVVDQACGAAAGTAFVAFLMGFCRSSAAATQYALLTAIAVAAPQLLRLAGGWWEAMGMAWFFTITIAAAIPGLLLLPVVSSRLPRTAERAASGAPTPG